MEINFVTTKIREFPGTDGISLVYHLFTNIYLIESDDGLIIIDTGLRGNTLKILRAIKKLGYKPQDVTQIILTHAHFDHFGSAAPLKTRTGAIVAAHSADKKSFERGGIGVLPGEISQRIENKLLHPSRFLGAPPVQIDRVLNDGDFIGEWEVIHTPGHTPGTINLFSIRRKVLITGGWAIPGTKVRNSSDYKNPFVGYISSDSQLINSAQKRLSQFDFQTLLCSHFPPRLFPLIARQLRALENSFE